MLNKNKNSKHLFGGNSIVNFKNLIKKLTLSGNRSLTKNFLTKTVLKMIDYNVNNPEDLEYDKENL